jgi:hypothetical protein
MWGILLSSESRAESGQLKTSGSDEAVVIVKAAPQIGKKHGETVCCAAIDLYGNWLRLYPVSFRTLAEGKEFGRWDRIKFKWRRPSDDSRMESRRIDQNSLKIVGQLKPAERERFLAKLIVHSLDEQRELGRSFALLRPQIKRFVIEKRDANEIAEERNRIADLHAQADLFNSQNLIPRTPCPYKFKYLYSDADKERTATCQDWETEATFFKWSAMYGEARALEDMMRVFGTEYPSKGMLFAMGTHSQYPDTWLMNGIVRLNEVKQPTLF